MNSDFMALGSVSHHSPATTGFQRLQGLDNRITAVSRIKVSKGNRFGLRPISCTLERWLKSHRAFVPLPPDESARLAAARMNLLTVDWLGLSPVIFAVWLAGPYRTRG